MDTIKADLFMTKSFALNAGTCIAPVQLTVPKLLQYHTEIRAGDMHLSVHLEYLDTQCPPRSILETLDLFLQDMHRELHDLRPPLQELPS